MTSRRNIFKGSAVLFLALTTGCSGVAATNPASGAGAIAGAGLTGGAGLISNNASGLISNNAGGLISNNAGGLISNNAGGLISNNAGGLISNNAGGLISNNAGGLISNNAGGLTGTVRGPAAGLISNNAGGLISNNAGGLISNNAGGLISNNAGGLISNNAGGLISNNAGGYELMAAPGGDDNTQVIAGAKCAVFNERGEQLSYAWTTSDADGKYTFDRLKPSSSLCFVRAIYNQEGQQVSLLCASSAPRKQGLMQADLTPGTTIVAKKVDQAIQDRQISSTSIHPAGVAALVAEVSPVLSAKAVVAASIQSPSDCARTFDSLLVESPALAATIAATGQKEGITEAIGKTAAVTAATTIGGSAPNANTSSGSQAGGTTATSGGGSTGQVAAGGTAAGGAGGSGTTTTATGGGTTTTGGSGTTGTSGGTQAGGTTTTADPHGTIFTLGNLAASGWVDMPTGGNTFGLATRNGTSGGTLGSLSSALTFTVDGANAARSVAYDGNTAYYLVGNSIVSAAGTVNLTGVDQAADLAVKGGVAYLSVPHSNAIFKVNLADGVATHFSGYIGTGGFKDGSADTAAFNDPQGLCIVGNSVYVADANNAAIRKVDADGNVTTVAGGGARGAVDGSSSVATFSIVTDVTADDSGNLFAADQGNNTIRQIDASGNVTTIAGAPSHTLTGAKADGTGANASIKQPTSLAWGKVNGQKVLVVVQYDKSVRLVSGW